MIKLKELRNRKYNGKECVAFEYDVIDNDLPQEQPLCFTAMFRRNGELKTLWTMQVVIPRDQSWDSQVYTIEYVLPKADMHLETVAAVGLKYFQMKLQEEIQKKSNWEFVIGFITNGL